MKVRFLLSAFLLLLSTISAMAQEEGRVIVSIKPLHSLVAAIMGDTGNPMLLVGGMHSPHGYQLAPSQVSSLHHADIVFYIGPGLETFLLRPLETVPATVKKAVMIDTPGITILKPRTGGAWEPDEHEEEAHDHDAIQDPHIWLDVTNAKIMATEIAKDLGELYPANKAIYERNAQALTGRLGALDAELKARLEPVKDKPYIVFHDAFQYFEHDYGLSAVGSITLEPEQEPGVKRISEVREKVRSSGIKCVFSEPQFNARLVETVIEGTDAKTGILDEHGADISEGPDLYFTLMRKIADGFHGCLEKTAN